MSRLEHAHPVETPLVVGIDLGTTNSLLSVASAITLDPAALPPRGSELAGAAMAQRARVQLVSLRQEHLDGVVTEEPLFPSAVFQAQDSRRLVGIGAKEARFSYERGKRVFYSVKKDLGTARDPFYPDAVSPDLDTPMKVSAQVLRSMREAAEGNLGRSLEGVPVVITVPASFQSSQRRDTLRAAALAGFRLGEDALFDEPNAALLAYIHRGKPQANWHSEERVLVFDFGGGTCDVSVVDVELTPRSHAVHLSNRSLSRFEVLGGDDIDLHLVHTVLKQQFYEAAKRPERSWGFNELRYRIWSQLAKLAESLKLRICDEMERVCRGTGWNEKLFSDRIVALGPQEISTSNGPVLLQRPSLTYEQFKAALGPFLDVDGKRCKHFDSYNYSVTSIFAPILDALEKADLTHRDISRVLMVGGSSYNWLVQQSIGEYFDHADVDRPEQMETLVAEGAALHAFYHFVEGHDVLAAITGDTIGLQLEGGGFAPLVQSGSSIPSPKDGGWLTYTQFRVPHDGLRRIDLVICAGNATRPVAKVELVSAQPLPHHLPIDLKVRLDGSKVFHLEAFLPDRPNVSVAASVESPLSTVPLTALEQRRIQLEQKLTVAKRDGTIDVPESVAAMQQLAEVHNELGHYEQADAWLKVAIRRGGETDELLAQRAWSLYGLGELGESHDLYADIATRQPHYNYMAGLTAQDITEQERFMRQAVQARPGDGISYYGLGLALGRQARYAESREAYVRSRSLLEQQLAAFPRDTQVMRFLANVFGKLGMQLEATRMRQRLEAPVPEEIAGPDHRPAVAPQMVHSNG